MTLNKLDDLQKAFIQLKEGVAEVQNNLDRDGVIKRFEFTFELVWKVIQEYLKYKGFVTASPRDALRKAADYGLIDDPQVWFGFLEDRNETTHIYSEEEIKIIFSHIPNFISEVEKLLEKITAEEN